MAKTVQKNLHHCWFGKCNFKVHFVFLIVLDIQVMLDCKLIFLIVELLWYIKLPDFFVAKHSFANFLVI